MEMRGRKLGEYIRLREKQPARKPYNYLVLIDGQAPLMEYGNVRIPTRHNKGKNGLVGDCALLAYRLCCRNNAACTRFE